MKKAWKYMVVDKITGQALTRHVAFDLALAAAEKSDVAGVGRTEVRKYSATYAQGMGKPWKPVSSDMTEHLRKAGSVKSDQKAAAARANGKLGGRPKKQPE